MTAEFEEAECPLVAPVSRHMSQRLSRRWSQRVSTAFFHVGTSSGDLGGSGLESELVCSTPAAAPEQQLISPEEVPNVSV